jgi:MFS family permease
VVCGRFDQIERRRPVTTPGPRRSEIVAVYAAGLFQGLSLVAVPAAATVLTSTTAYDLSASQYGLLFLPQVILAITGSLALSSLAGRIGLKRVLMVGLLADTVAMTLLVVSNSVQDDTGAFPMLLVATGSLGLGFGLTLGSISTYAGAFQPQRREVALTALNVLLGLGTALSPLLVAVFLDIGEWWYLPLGTAVGLAVVLILTVAQPLVAEASRARGTARPPIPRRFWIFVAALVAYGAAETMFGTGAPRSWSTTGSRPPPRPTHSPRSGRRSPWADSSSPSSRTASARPTSTSCSHGSSPWPSSLLLPQTPLPAGSPCSPSPASPAPGSSR